MEYKQQVIEFARKSTPAGQDTKYNKGRKHCIEGNIYSEEAHYFLLCSGFIAH